MDPSNLKSIRVLLVEDEPLVAMLLEDQLAELGCVVAATAVTVPDALDKVAATAFDIAILDVNLNGAQSYPVAELLRDRKIPFVFSTGYGEVGVPQSLRVAPILAKPFTEEDLKQALLTALG